MIHIDLFADIACPWCYLGETRLHNALAQRPGLRAQFRWRPFQLEPMIPARGAPWKEFVRTKFGGSERAQSIFTHLTEVGADAGIEFDFNRMSVVANTRDAHRLILMSTDGAQQRRIARELFRAYFSEGANVGDTGTLAGIGARAGLQEGKILEYLNSDEGIRDVEESQNEAAGLGVTGVPFYIFNGRYAFTGAQSVEAFLRAIDAATTTEAERSTVAMVR